MEEQTHTEVHTADDNASLLGQTENLFKAKMDSLKSMVSDLASEGSKTATAQSEKKAPTKAAASAEEKAPAKAVASTEEKTPAKEQSAEMDEGTPDFLTGDAEAPAGEKDMGGWTMRVYTAEQQTRLNVDEEGKPLESTDVPADNEMEVPETRKPEVPWTLLLVGLSLLMVVLVAVV